MKPRTIQPGSPELRRESRHQALARDIREQIVSGRLQPGDRLPSFTDLRGRWGVGRDTLERMYAALERDGLIVREHRRGVFVSVPQERKKAYTVGFVNKPPHQCHPYYAELLEGVRSQAEASGAEVLLLSDKGAVNWEKVDGVIYQTTTGGHLGTLAAPPELPRVCLIQMLDVYDCVVPDDTAGMTQAMRHLLDLGHRRIAFLTLEMLPHAMSSKRLTAYSDSLRAAGIEATEAWKRCLHEPEKTGRTWEKTGYDDMREWLRDNWNEQGCTAILAHNDDTAIGVIAALQEAGLRVPEDVSVVGFDGTEIASIHRPRIATVKVPLREIGASGFDLLKQQLDRPLQSNWSHILPRCLSLPTRFQPGDSTGPALRRRNDYVE